MKVETITWEEVFHFFKHFFENIEYRRDSKITNKEMSVDDVLVALQVTVEDFQRK